MVDPLSFLGLALVVLGLALLAVAERLRRRAEARRALAELHRIEASFAEDLRAADCRRWSRGRRSRRAHG